MDVSCVKTGLNAQQDVRNDLGNLANVNTKWLQTRSSSVRRSAKHPLLVVKPEQTPTRPMASCWVPVLNRGNGKNGGSARHCHGKCT